MLKSQRAISHIWSVLMSCPILNTRFFGDLFKHLRYQVNGGYLCGPTQSKHKWSDKLWDMIDMTAFGKNFKVISLKCQVHSYPNTSGRPTIPTITHQEYKHETCPIWKSQEDKIHHFLHWHQNPNQAKSIETMLSTILKDTHPSSPILLHALSSIFNALSKKSSVFSINPLATSMILCRWRSRNKCKLVGTNSPWDICQRKGLCLSQWTHQKLDTST